MNGLQIVIPMAGRGERFSEAGYDRPKPFIDVNGQPMIARVMDNLRVPAARYILIARAEHLDQEPAVATGLTAHGDVAFVTLDQVTEGAACTVLMARKQLDRDAPLLIANCDQIVDFNCAAFIADAHARHLDGSILCFREPQRNPKWSFAKIDGQGLVTEVREKDPFSDLATVGLYYFRRAGDFMDAAVDMIVRNERTNNEFYVCPAFNHVIANGLTVGVYEVPVEAMHGIGTPEDLRVYLDLTGAAG